MMHGTAIWKRGIGEMAKASKSIAPGTHNGGLQHPIWTPCGNGQRNDTPWVISFDHKTQSFVNPEKRRSAKVIA